MQRLIILRGYPGSGKTTIGKRLESENLGKFVDHNNILNFIAGYTNNDTGIYEEINLLERAIAQKLLIDKNSVIVGRGFSKFSSVKPYIKLAMDLVVPYYIFTLKVPTKILENRVVSIDRKNDFNPTKSKQALNSWIESNPLQVIDDEKIIDATQTINDIFIQIRHFLDD